MPSYERKNNQMNVCLVTKSGMAWSTTKAQCRPEIGDRYQVLKLTEPRVVVVKGLVQDLRSGEFIATVEMEDAEAQPKQRDVKGAKEVQQQVAGASVPGVRGKRGKSKKHTSSG